MRASAERQVRNVFSRRVEPIHVIALTGVAVRPGDPHTLYVRTTFGLVISANDGCSFHWVCEQAIGYGGDFDPKYAVAADGTLYAATYAGLRVSRDVGDELLEHQQHVPD